MTITLKGIPHRLVAFLTLFPSPHPSVPLSLSLSLTNDPMSSLSLLSISCSCNSPSSSIFLLYVSWLVLPSEVLSLALFSLLSLSFLLSRFFFQPVHSLGHPPPLLPFSFSFSLSLILTLTLTLSLSFSLCVSMYVCSTRVCVCVALSCKRVKSRFACCIELLVGSV